MANLVKKNAGRIDFKIEVLGERTDENGEKSLRVEFIPDPRRYDVEKKDGKTCWKDKYTGYIYDEKIIEEMAKGMDGLPIYYSPPKEDDLSSYLLKQKAEIEEHWDERYRLTKEYKPFDELLIEFAGRRTRVVIMYVDMAGSTQLSEALDEETNIKVVKLFLMQISKIVDIYNGYVFKMNGDCVIGVFPADANYTGMSDNSIRACMAIRSLIEYVLNPIFKDRKIPNIGFHIGIDIGTVNVDSIGASGVISSLDIIGRDMNVVAKIEQKAGPNEVLLGRRLYEVLHCSLQEYCKEVNLGPSWKLKDPEREEKYRVFRFGGRWIFNKLEGEDS